MDNGCPKCEKLLKEYVFGEYLELCLYCQLEQAEQNVYAAMNEVERIKQKIKEKHELSSSKK